MKTPRNPQTSDQKVYRHESNWGNWLFCFSVDNKLEERSRRLKWGLKHIYKRGIYLDWRWQGHSELVSVLWGVILIQASPPLHSADRKTIAYRVEVSTGAALELRLGWYVRKAQQHRDILVSVVLLSVTWTRASPRTLRRVSKPALFSTWPCAIFHIVKKAWGKALENHGE